MQSNSSQRVSHLKPPQSGKFNADSFGINEAKRQKYLSPQNIKSGVHEDPKFKKSNLISPNPPMLSNISALISPTNNSTQHDLNFSYKPKLTIQESEPCEIGVSLSNCLGSPTSGVGIPNVSPKAQLKSMTSLGIKREAQK